MLNDFVCSVSHSQLYMWGVYMWGDAQVSMIDVLMDGGILFHCFEE